VNLEFATAAQVSDAFSTGFVAVGAVASVMAAVAYLGGRTLPTPLRGRWVAWGYGLGLCVAAAGVYASSWGRFVSLQADAAGLELRYAGQWQLPVRLQAGDIHTVLVGWGKPGRPCYVRLVLQDGSSHRSSDLPAPAAQCRALQAQLLAWQHSAAQAGRAAPQ
jgi:hypothetical protein